MRTGERGPSSPGVSPEGGGGREHLGLGGADLLGQRLRVGGRGRPRVGGGRAPVAGVGGGADDGRAGHEDSRLGPGFGVGER